MSNLSTPVLLIIFNRPNTTEKVFEAIRQVQPRQLFIAADGPRPDQSADQLNCEKAREIVTQIDWPCEVKTLFQKENLGCKIAVSSAINWFFDNVEQGIILEDDCLPDPSFFYFCQELLMRFRDNHEIFVVSGDNFQHDRDVTSFSYYFSRYCHNWGWATWRRAWKTYDLNMKSWPNKKKQLWPAAFAIHPKEIAYWTNLFDRTYQGEIDTWDYQWLFAVWAHSALTVLPSVNLVQNIGFDSNATHTFANEYHFSHPAKSMTFPLAHPSQIEPNMEADNYTYRNHYCVSKLKILLKRLLSFKSGGSLGSKVEQ